jgi:hypothetical protein
MPPIVRCLRGVESGRQGLDALDVNDLAENSAEFVDYRHQAAWEGAAVA